METILQNASDFDDEFYNHEMQFTVKYSGVIKSKTQPTVCFHLEKIRKVSKLHA